MKDLRPGDLIHHGYVFREIVDVRPTGYGWRYPEHGKICPDGSENYWWSENSSDPFFVLGWKKVGVTTQSAEQIAPDVLKRVADWYRTEGWRLDEDDVPAAIEALK